MDELKKYRKEIDNIDKELVRNFEKRMEVVLKVAEYKKKNNIPILNKSREEQVIEKNLKYLNNEKFKKSLKDFFISLMNISKKLQK